jgi:CheY-like chemotaxis protein
MTASSPFAAAPEKGLPAQAKAGTTMAKYRILYVDDEDDIREVASMSLELEADFEIRSCSSGPEALIVAREWLPHLVLLDVMMPGMDGPATLEQLLQMPETEAIPIVFITARTQTHEVERFLSLGAKGVIAKPFDPMSLAQDVKAYVATDELV